MKAEKIYNTIMEAVSSTREIDNASTEFIKKCILNGEIVKITPFLEMVTTIGTAAREEMQKDHAKSGGKSKERAAGMKIIKSANPARPVFKGAQTDSEGRTIVCDGFRAIRWEPGEAPEMPEGEKTGDYLEFVDRISKQIDRPADASKIVKCYTAAEIKDYIADCKATGYGFVSCRADKPVIEIPGADGALFNADFLLTAVEAIPDATVYYKSRLAPLYLVSERVTAIVLPVRRKDGDSAEYTPAGLAKAMQD